MLTRTNIMKQNTVVYAKTTAGADQLIKWAKRENLLCSNMIDYNNYIQDNSDNTICYCVRDSRVLDLEYCKSNDYTIISLDGKEEIEISSRLVFSLIGIIIILAIIFNNGVV